MRRRRRRRRGGGAALVVTAGGGRRRRGVGCVGGAAGGGQVWDWELDGAAMAALDGLEAGLVTGWDPVAASLAECDRH